jgi:hypothetical protein
MTFRPQTRAMPDEEYEALTAMLYHCPPVVQSSLVGTSIWMLDDDLMPTQTMAAVRWIMTDNHYDCNVFQIDNAGIAVQIVRED